MAVFGTAFFRITAVIFIIGGVQAKTNGSTTVATTVPTTVPTTVLKNTSSNIPTPATNQSSTALPTTLRNHSTANPTKQGNYSTTQPTTLGNHSTIPPTKPGNHSTMPPSKSGKHTETTSHSSKTPSQKGHGKGGHGDSHGKWVAVGFAVFFAITTIIMAVLYCRQRKIYRELEGDSSLSRLI